MSDQTPSGDAASMRAVPGKAQRETVDERDERLDALGRELLDQVLAGKRLEDCDFLRRLMMGHLRAQTREFLEAKQSLLPGMMLAGYAFTEAHLRQAASEPAQRFSQCFRDALEVAYADFRRHGVWVDVELMAERGFSGEQLTFFTAVVELGDQLVAPERGIVYGHYGHNLEPVQIAERLGLPVADVERVLTDFYQRARFRAAHWKRVYDGNDNPKRGGGRRRKGRK
ncbi:MAG: hypothetical protein JNJ88_11875 [Planctomycetes bacterium]|nr:hypothetical protein [Planctomycetota bacterium]